MSKTEDEQREREVREMMKRGFHESDARFALSLYHGDTQGDAIDTSKPLGKDDRNPQIVK